jgi:hypothetical protein
MAPPAIPPVMTIEGDVVAVHSYWTGDGSRIVTAAQVRTPDGAEVTVSQLGGSVDGIGMITMPGPPRLALGMTVAIAAHRDLDQARQEHIVLDSAKVLAYPPGFVRTGPTKGGKSLYWESGCVYITLDAPGTTALANDQEFAIIDASIATWNTGTASCSYLKLINEGRKALEVGRDDVNLIKFRDTTWGRPAIGDDPARSYEVTAQAITTTIFVDSPGNPRDGEILDADIEFNGVNFAISVNGMTTSRQGCKVELQNTLTHELGHLQGLEHPCYLGGDPRWVDNLGNAVPSCLGQLPATITEATMYPSANCDETKKATLSDDDVAAMCTIYPIASDKGVCNRLGSTTAGCCSASGPFDRPDGSFLLAGAAVLILRRRRKTSRRA